MERLRKERLRLGLSLEEAARGMGSNVSDLEGWESGRVELLGSQLVMLSRFYGCSPDWLLGLANERETGLVRMR